MTEIAILNKYGIALAADRVDMSKTRVFQLSNTVGILVHDDSDFLAIPWKELSRLYKKEIGERTFETLEDCANAYINFFSREGARRKTLSEKIEKLEPKNKDFSIIIFGYGYEDHLPSLIKYSIKSLVIGALTYEIQSYKIDPSNHSCIYASKEEMESAFVIEADDEFKINLLNGVTDTLDSLTKEFTATLKEHDLAGLSEIKRNLNNKKKNILLKYEKNLSSYQFRSHLYPAYSVVAILPLRELASYLESLMNLTLFNKMGAKGSFDVVFITKGDGWMEKRIEKENFISLETHNV